MQDYKRRILDNTILKLRNNLNPMQLDMVRLSLEEELSEVDIIPLQTAVSTYIDENQYLLEMMLMRREGKISKNTLYNYLNAMKNLLTVIDKGIKDIVSFDIERYLIYYRKKGNTQGTVNNERAYLSASFTWFRKNNYISHNPVEQVEKVKEVKKPIDFMSTGEIEIAREGCRDLRDRALFEFLLSTGVRVGEVKHIKTKDIDWMRSEILILGEKGSEYRTVYLTDMAKLHLKKYIFSRNDDSPYLFHNRKQPQYPLKEGGIQLLIKEIGERSSLERTLYPHLFRKTLGTILRNRGCQMPDIQVILGHKSSATTEKYYAGVDNEMIRMVHRKFATA